MSEKFPTPTVDDGWTPARGIPAAAAALGSDPFVDWCLLLLDGQTLGADPDTPSLRWIGGAAAGTDDHRDHWGRSDLTYWPRVWAARALRYVWAQRAAPVVIAALADEAWRVREHCCVLAGMRELADAAGRLAELTDPDIEPTKRVRVAAVRALALVGEYEQADALRRATIDPEGSVRDAADAALHQLADRLDRPL